MGITIILCTFMIFFMYCQTSVYDITLYSIERLIIDISIDIREHPFNLKGEGGYGFFGGKQILSANLIEKNFLSLKWEEKHILLALCALTNIVFVQKTFNFCCTSKRKIINLTPKKL